jgi:peroxiredoxin
MTQASSPVPSQPDEPTGAGTSVQQVPRAPRLRVLPRFLVLAATLLLLIGVFALAHTPPASVPTRSDTTKTSAQTSGAQTSGRTALAPDFTLMTLGGRTFHLAGEQGRIVVLYFMATGCASCGAGSQDLAQTLPQTKLQGVEALAIDLNAGDRPADLQAFIQSVGIPATAPVQWGIDTTGAIANAYHVQTLETTVVIDTRGRVAYQSNSSVPPEQLAQIVRNLA